MSSETVPTTAPTGGVRPLRPRGQVASQIFLVAASVLWLLPLLFALYVAVRPYSDTRKHGYVSLPHDLTLSNFTDAWSQSDMGKFFWNSIVITVPAPPPGPPSSSPG